MSDKRCSRCHAPLDPLDPRWHCDGDRVQGRHGGWEHDCGGAAVAMAEPTPIDRSELRQSLASLHSILERVAVDNTDLLTSEDHRALFAAAALLNRVRV